MTAPTVQIRSNVLRLPADPTEAVYARKRRTARARVVVIPVVTSYPCVTGRSNARRPFSHGLSPLLSTPSIQDNNKREYMDHMEPIRLGQHCEQC